MRATPAAALTAALLVSKGKAHPSRGLAQPVREGANVGDRDARLLRRVDPSTSSTQEQESDDGTPEVISTSTARPSAALPEPYLTPGVELPSYIVGAVAASLPIAPAPQAAVRTPPLPYNDTRTADDLVYYWDELRGHRALPLLEDIDRTRIAISWPNTVMATFGADRSEMPQITRLSRFTGAIEVTTIVTEWIISCCRQVAKIGKAMETQRTFTGKHELQYSMMLLPLASSNGTSNHVLCHLCCNP